MIIAERTVTLGIGGGNAHRRIEDADVIEKILTHLDEKGGSAEAFRWLPCRPPDDLEILEQPGETAFMLPLSSHEGARSQLSTDSWSPTGGPGFNGRMRERDPLARPAKA